MNRARCVPPRCIPLVLCLAFALSGCGEKTVTLTARSATEQLLLSAAADRAIDQAGTFRVSGKKTFLDTSAIDTVDKTYVIAQWQAALSRHGAILQKKAEGADLAVAPRAGALAMDRSSWLLGLPEMTLPIPLAGDIRTPELALFKLATYRAVAKFAALGTDPADGSCLFDTGHQFGQARERHLWVLFFGPFTFSDAMKNPQPPYEKSEQ